MPIIRDADTKDLAAITEIYNDAVINTFAIWNEQIVDIENRREWLKTRTQAGYPILVVEYQGKTCGYASYGPFRPFDGYKFSAELSIYLAANMRGKGMGKKLLSTLIDHAQNHKIHILIAAIDAENTASIALHQNFGFVKTAHMPEVGFKKGRWLDLVMLQKKLSST